MSTPNQFTRHFRSGFGPNVHSVYSAFERWGSLGGSSAGPVQMSGFGDIPQGDRKRVGVTLFAVAFVGYLLGQSSKGKTSSLPSVGTLLVSFAAFKVLDSFWKDIAP